MVNNTIHIDFDIFSTYEDAFKDRNSWKECNYSTFEIKDTYHDFTHKDPNENFYDKKQDPEVGFPAWCGPTKIPKSNEWTLPGSPRT